jgi:CYTH domain-containing protein
MDGGSGVQYKLGKKYGDHQNYSESITNIYLSSEEYELLRQFAGVEVTKTRYRIAGGSLDIYTDDRRPMIFSVEFRSETEAMEYQPPEFLLDEVTDNQEYSGYVLAVGEE